MTGDTEMSMGKDTTALSLMTTAEIDLAVTHGRPLSRTRRGEFRAMLINGGLSSEDKQLVESALRITVAKPGGAA